MAKSTLRKQSKQALGCSNAWKGKALGFVISSSISILGPLPQVLSQRLFLVQTLGLPEQH